jgi:hypothetical protein
LGSGWSISNILSTKVHIVPYTPTQPTSYIQTPKYLANKRAVLNIENKLDNLCFAWSILAHLHPVDNHPKRVTKYEPYISELNLCGLKMPLPVSDIGKFEKLNAKISVNVLAFDSKTSCIYPVYVTLHKDREHHINLLVITEEKCAKSHYVLIRNMSRLLGDRTNHDGAYYTATIVFMDSKKMICYRII